MSPKYQSINIIGHPIVFKYNNKRILPKVSTIMDCGACMGMFTIHLRHYIKGKYYLYEPNKSLYEFLTKKDDEDDIKIYNLAIDSIIGEKEFYLGNIKKSSSLLSSHRNLSNDSYTIKTTTLDKEVEDIGKVDLLKLDIEGSEIDVILNTSSDTFEKINQITLEYHTQSKIDSYTINDIKKCDKHLLKNGFIKLIGNDSNVCYIKEV